MDTAGVPRDMAFQIAMGHLSLRDGLSRLARSSEIDKLMRRHDLSSELATQVVLGETSLQTVLLRLRREEYFVENRDRSFLTEACTQNTTDPLKSERVTLLIHGHKRLVGHICEVQQYQILFKDDAGLDTIRKVEIKVGWRVCHDAAVALALGGDSDGGLSEAPIDKPQDRFRCSNKHLFRLLDGEIAVCVELLEGTSLDGVIVWIGRWEFGLRVDDDAVVSVFRHAMKGLEVTDGSI